MLQVELINKSSAAGWEEEVIDLGEETYSISPAVETEWTSIQSLYNHGWISTSSAGVEQCSNMEVIWYVSKLTLFCLFFIVLYIQYLQFPT